MAKLVTDDVANFASATITTINENFADIETAMENTLSRDGTSPNQMEADLDMNSHDILNVNSITINGVDLSDLGDLAAALAEAEADADRAELAAAAAEASANSNVTKFVDVRVVATSNVDIAGGGLAAGQVVDGVTLVTDYLVLLTGQSSGAQNGVYVVPASGAASRDPRFNSYALLSGSYFSVLSGTSYRHTLWRCISVGGTIDVTAIAFEQFVSYSALAKTANYTIVNTDAGKIINVDATSGDKEITLPTAALGVNRGIFYVRKADQSTNSVIVKTQSGEKIGGDGPYFDVDDVVNQGGEFGIYAVDERLSRNFVAGAKVTVAGVGGTTDANGTWTIGRIQVGGNNVITLTGSTFAGVYTSGGTVTLYQTQVDMRIEDDIAGFVSDGTRWFIVSGPPYLMNSRDFILGRNADYTGYGMNPGLGVARDFLWDSQTLRLWIRTLVITEAADTPETIYRRAEVNVAGGSTYPDGPDWDPMPVNGTIGMHHYTSYTNAGGFEARSAQMHGKAAEDAVSGSLGGYLVFATSPIGTAAGCLDRMYVYADGSVSIGNLETLAQFNVRSSANKQMIYARNDNASLGVPQTYLYSAATSGHTFVTCENPTGLKFYVNVNGAVASDGGTAMSSPADYAEYIREWWDGNPNAEDRFGKSVVLVDRNNPDKIIMPGRHKAKDVLIRLAETVENCPVDAIIGIVSVDPSVIGRSYWNGWKGKIERDKWGRPILEEAEFVSWKEKKPTTTERLAKAKMTRLIGETEVIQKNKFGEDEVVTSWEETPHGYFADRLPEGVVPPEDAKREMVPREKISKDYDPKKPYKSRKERSEWDHIGLLGQLPLLDDQPVNPRWMMLGELSDGLEEWLVR